MSNAAESKSKLSPAETLRYGAEAALFFAFIGLFRVLGVERASALGGFMGRNIAARSRVSKRARDNLAAAYPDMSEAERDAILAEMWDNLGRVAGEYAHLDKMSLNGPDPRMEVVGQEHIRRAQEAGRGIIFVSGHFANWETMPFAAAQLGLESGEVYRPLNNPFVDRWIVKQRMANGPKEQIAKGAQGTRRIFTMLRGGKAILLLADQKTNEGLPVPFFGRTAMTTPAPAVFALKLGAAVLPASNERLPGPRFRMTVHPPIEYAKSGDHDRDVFELTQKINDAIEACVRYRPSQWLWIHRRWPSGAADVPRSRRGLEAQALGGSGVTAESEGSSGV